MFRWFQKKFRPARRRMAQAHLTFGQTSVGRSITRAGLLLKKQLWIWPIVAILILSIVGYRIRAAIERTIKSSLQSELTTLLSVEQAMLEKWFKAQEANAVSVANDPHIRKIVTALVTANREASARPATDAPPPATDPAELRQQLARELEPVLSTHEFVGYVLADKTQQVVAAFTPELIDTVVPQFEDFLTPCLSGEAIVSVPFPSVVLLRDAAGRRLSGVPTMFVAAPVFDENLQVVAALAMRVRPELEFTDILQLGRIGSSGETYAFNKEGMMVSNSRFDGELILLGLIPDVEDARSILNISLRDPGGNLAEGFRPTVRRAELPLCEPVARALGGENGADVAGYRNYRGATSVGAWAWLPRYQLGLITELDYREAFRPLTILQWAFYTLYGLLVAAAIAIFVFTLVVARLQREARKAALEAKHLGQYRLEECLGAGAMGVVYKGHHAMLRRATAIKILKVDKVNEASTARFEREVQITCQLNHPNTVAVFDYGRTPEGVFYYAMEYLDGIDLQALVERYGPQPDARVIHILRQVCGSLFEAHSQGLVHRDVKPANIMLNRRGGEPDVIKVLDFGLVKALDDDRKVAGMAAGTPLYMSPESIQTPAAVDARSDIYSVGAVGYFLLTGQTVFSAGTLADLCQQHISAVPESPSQRLGRTVSPQLENALLACLEKNPARRPQTARDLANLLERAIVAERWTTEDADAWWGRHERSQPANPARATTLPATPAATTAADKDANTKSFLDVQAVSTWKMTQDFDP